MRTIGITVLQLQYLQTELILWIRLIYTFLGIPYKDKKKVALSGGLICLSLT
jgi:hypothetical protein